METIKDTLRLDVINHTNNLDKRLFKLYDLIESDLLGPLVCSPNYISSYKASSLYSPADGRVYPCLELGQGHHA